MFRKTDWTRKQTVKEFLDSSSNEVFSAFVLNMFEAMLGWFSPDFSFTNEQAVIMFEKMTEYLNDNVSVDSMNHAKETAKKAEQALKERNDENSV